MSKATVLALAITEAAAASFRASGTSNIERAIWHQTLDSSDFQKLVFQNIKPVRSFFTRADQPTLADFRDFKNEYVAHLNDFMKWSSVRAFFLMLQAEKEMTDRVPEDFFSEILYDFIFEDCEEFLGEHA
jgi:hypothetical protein